MLTILKEVAELVARVSFRQWLREHSDDEAGYQAKLLLIGAVLVLFISVILWFSLRK